MWVISKCWITCRWCAPLLHDLLLPLSELFCTCLFLQNCAGNSNVGLRRCQLGTLVTWQLGRVVPVGASEAFLEFSCFSVIALLKWRTDSPHLQPLDCSLLLYLAFDTCCYTEIQRQCLSAAMLQASRWTQAKANELYCRCVYWLSTTRPLESLALGFSTVCFTYFYCLLSGCHSLARRGGKCAVLSCALYCSSCVNRPAEPSDSVPGVRQMPLLSRALLQDPFQAWVEFVKCFHGWLSWVWTGCKNNFTCFRAQESAATVKACQCKSWFRDWDDIYRIMIWLLLYFHGVPLLLQNPFPFIHLLREH